MAEIMNISAVHNNGAAELTIGIRDKQFTLRLDIDKNKVSLVNPKSNQLIEFGAKNINDTYTKEEINAKFENVMKFIGKFTSYSALLSAVDNGSLVPVKGNVAFIIAAGDSDINQVPIRAYTHVMYNGTGWQIL